MYSINMDEKVEVDFATEPLFCCSPFLVVREFVLLTLTFVATVMVVLFAVLRHRSGFMTSLLLYAVAMTTVAKLC